MDIFNKKNLLIIFLTKTIMKMTILWKITIMFLILWTLVSCGWKYNEKREYSEKHNQKGEGTEEVEKQVTKAEHVKPHDQTLEIAKGVYSYTFGGEYYSMFVVTSDGVIAIESINTKHSTGLLAAIKAVTDKPVKYMIHSHNHWDHASGWQVFKDAGAKTMAHIEAYEWMEANPGKDMAIPDESWSGKQKIVTLGETTLELNYLGMNHGLGMTVFLLPEEKVAYIADIVTPNRVLFTIAPDFNVKETERSMKEILELDFETVIFSHNEKENPLAGGTKADIQESLNFIGDLRGAIFAEFKKGTPTDQIPNIIDLPQYKDLKMYDEWLPMNAWKLILEEWMGPFPWRKIDA